VLLFLGFTCAKVAVIEAGYTTPRIPQMELTALPRPFSWVLGGCFVAEKGGKGHDMREGGKTVMRKVMLFVYQISGFARVYFVIFAT